MREQIESLTDAARSSATDIDRRARDDGEATRRDALEAGARVVGKIEALESELTTLLRSVSSEADGLRAKLARSEMRSAPAGARAPRRLESESVDAGRASLDAPAFPAPAAPEDAESDAPADTGLAGPDPEAEVEVVPEVEVVSEVEAEPEVQAEPEPEAEPEVETEPEVQAEPEPEAEPEVEGEAEVEGDAPREDDADGPVTWEAPEHAVSPADTADPPRSSPEEDEHAERTRSAEARARVAGTSDLELAELYRLAARNARDIVEDDLESASWEAVMEAVVEEAVSRPDFPSAPADPGSRRERKRQAKTLEPLIVARAQALNRAEAPPESGESGEDEEKSSG